MNKFFSKIAIGVVGLAMAVGVGVGLSSNRATEVRAEMTQALSWSRASSSTIDTVTTGFSITSSNGMSKSGYYQDASLGAGYVQVKKDSGNIWTTAPQSISFTAKVGGGTGNKDLSNAVFVCLVDSNGNDIANTETSVTSKITNATGDSYTVDISTNPTEAAGVKIYHNKESGYNVRYFSYSLSYEPAAGTSYDITTTVTNGTYIGASSVADGASATVTISPNNGYKLPDSVNVTGATLTSYDSSTGAVVVSNPTGAVSISATCVAATQYTVTTSLTNLTATGDTTIYENGTATVTLKVSDAETYSLPTALTSVTNAVDYSYNSSTGVITINGATGNVVITASAIDKPDEASETFSTIQSEWTTVKVNEDYTKNVDLITAEWKKGTSTFNAGAYWNPARFYSGHTLTITATTGTGAVNTIKEIVFTCDTNSYATSLVGNKVTRAVSKPISEKGSINATSSESIATFTMSGTVEEVTISFGEQVRIKSFVVTYEKDQSTVDLQSITATCESVLVSQQVSPVITYTPASASNKNVTYAITSGNGTIASVDENGVVTGLGEGTAKLKITPEDTNASAITIDVVVNALPDISTVSVGTKYALTATVSGTSYELTSMSTATSPNYGVGSSYSGGPAESFPVRVVNGSYAKTVALEVSISDTTYYLSYDAEKNENSLNVKTSIDRESSWIFADEDGVLVVRNVEVYSRKLACSNGRFACYQNYNATIVVPTFNEISETKADKEVVQDFVDLNMHMTDYDPELHVGEEGSNWCKDGSHSYYLTAKAALNKLTVDQLTIFKDDSDFDDAQERYEAWAVANNDAAPYDGNDSVVTPLRPAVVNFSNSNKSGNVTLIIVLVSISAITLAGGYFFLRKRKEQQ